MILLLGLILPVLSFFLESYPRFFNKYFGVDVWTILIETDLIRKNNHLIPQDKIKKGFIFEERFDYPPIFLILLSFLSKKHLEKYQGFISPIFDALTNLLIFFIALQLTSHLEIALVAQLLYSLTPITALENSMLYARSFGYLLFTASFYTMLLYSNLINPSPLLFLSAIALVVVTLLGHRFATQSLIFISIFFSLIERNLTYFTILAIGLILAIVISRGYYLQVLKSHLSNIYFWMKNYENRFSHQVYGRLPTTKNPDLVGTIYNLLSKFAPFTLLFSALWIASGIIIFIFNIPLSPLLYKMALWVLFFYVFAILVMMIKCLIPIGEGYRYIEMITAPASILSSYIFFYFYNSNYRLTAVIILGILLTGNLMVILFLQYKAVISDRNRSLTVDMKEMFKFINKIKGTPRIMCIPHQITTMLVYNTKAKVLVGIDTYSVKYMKDFYPVIKKPLSKTLKKFEIDYVLLRESFSKFKDLKITKSKIIHRSGDVLLIKV